jgi:superfamily II DNA or RNA helicase
MSVGGTATTPAAAPALTIPGSSDAFPVLSFRHEWRPYQQRVLGAVDEHLSDKRLHVVAAPGAGKTSLGLEIFRRLRRRALVLSPTRVIRDQWIRRLRDFVDDGAVQPPEWVSTRLEHPAVFTSVTYQALHTRVADDLSADATEDAETDPAAPGDTQVDALVAVLRIWRIELLLLDEAHHLRAEWWRALERICAALPELVLVSLTATPPYDTDAHEWSRYERLCGPIDEEISVPELVQAGTLCPHQDFVWAVDASASERQRIRDYDSRVQRLCTALFESAEFSAVVRAHPWITGGPGEQDVVREPRIALALLAFLKARGDDLPGHLVTLLDVRLDDIPELGRRWWQVLVEAVLFSKTFTHDGTAQRYVAQLKRQLSSYDLLKRRNLSLERSRRLDRSLSLSVAKIDACVAIHRLELDARGDTLRQVVLIDYIRDEELATTVRSGEVNLGAWPVFRALAAASPAAERIGLLTGRISLVPRERLADLLAIEPSLQVGPAPRGDERYARIAGPSSALTAAFTALLLDGRLRTLVGTRALLGEGWDAPAVNSLVLASSVGAFMLTNQMRGRAIRTDAGTPGKISSIWHLVAIDTTSPSGLNDYRQLRARFETFVGLAELRDTIESGFERLGASRLERVMQPLRPEGAVAANNAQMTQRIAELDTVGERWRRALTVAGAARVLPSVVTPKVETIRRFHVIHTLKYVLGQIAALALAFVGIVTGHARNLGTLLVLLLLAAVAAALYLLPKTIQAVRILLRHLPVDGSVHAIGMALCESLCQTGLVATPHRQLRVRTIAAGDGSVHVALAGGTFYESSLFADCMAEILGPIDNPRYLVVRSGTIYGMARDDYHAVPLPLAVRKEHALTFHRAWTAHVGPSEMIYTRDAAGRSRLLRARAFAFSTAFASQVKRQDRWEAT